jgi:response regulator RpfG family c-di-GMP phosphodiesterase
MAKDDRRHTLLIVDDEPGLLQTLRHLFLRDYRVLTAENGHAAIDLLGLEDVHAILSDQRMPGMTGDVLLAQARTLRPDAVRMLFTGYADIQAVISAVNEGRIFRYILKPWDPMELEGIVRQAVEHHDLIVDRRRLIAELREANDRLSRANRELTEANEQRRALLETGRLRSDLETLARRVQALEGASMGASQARFGVD